MTFDWLPYAYWALIIGCFAAIILFAREPVDDASSDGPHGDVIALPDDFETVFHSACVTEGSQPNHGAR